MGFTDGYAKTLDSAAIEYTYHKHVDANGNKISSTTTSSVKGGCLTQGSHVHVAGCEGTCTVTAICTDSFQGETGNWCNTFTYTHSSCGQSTTTGSSWQTYSRQGSVYTTTHSYYKCGNKPINNYSIGCGKTTSTIESATIVFQ